MYNMRISNMWRHNNNFKHSHVLIIVIIMWFLFQCVVSSSTCITIPTFVGNQQTTKADKQVTCTDKERNALLDFKAGLRDPNNYDCISAWGTKREDGDDCCNWNGVTCNNQTSHVTELHLGSCGLRGEFSISLLNVTCLTLLDLSWNFFSGIIPKSIGSLIELRKLDLSWNSFNGTIPKSIGFLAELREIHLSGNFLNGNIPESIGSLTELRELELSGNFFNGNFPESIRSLTQLRKLDLSSNSFNGTIPRSIGSMIELRRLDLTSNSFDGTIPRSIGSMTKLRELYLSRNSFNGTIPGSIGYLVKLRELDLSRNSFNGTIFDSIGSLTELRGLYLTDNYFNGTILESIGYVTELRVLYLSGNSFSGTIPLGFGNLVNLERLDLADLGRCSVKNISWLSHLSHLEDLDMSGISLAKGNHWVNAILSLQNLRVLLLERCDLSRVMHPYSSSLSQLNSSPSSNIIALYLRDNNLNSSMYTWLYPLTRSGRLVTLDLSGNKLDEFPIYLGNLCNLTSLYFTKNSALLGFSDFMKSLSSGCTSDTLTYLYASSSQFTGSMSDDIQHFSSLEILDLSYNQLNGTISEKIWELPMLYQLKIAMNIFKGAIFEQTGSRVSYLDISFNNFSQGAPDLLSVTGTTVLVLSSNNFYGPVRNVSSSLKVLNLSKNKFFGGISFLCQIVDGYLTYLDLSHNSFSGQIPDCLWHFKKLKLLNLAHNNLSGRLPASFEYLIQLDVLDLYNNNFFGELPLSLRNCLHLTSLDLGANRFSSNLPVWIGENLLGLYVLSLGSNNFNGPIPLQFCQLVKLQILDLSMNNLSGSIPSCVNNLTSMVQQGFLSAHSLRQYILYMPQGFSEVNDYIDNVIVQWQGIRREFTNNLGLLKSIDLSSNNLTGQIPNELTDLRGLLALNLSRNALFGEIPQKIGQVKDLLMLDLSRNHFSGGIPLSISEMFSLSSLDVSYNNLSGRIPPGTQLQSFETSSYTGNAELCGLPLSKYCPEDEELQVPSLNGEREGDTDELDRWFYICGAIGFSIAFWIVCSTLLINRRGRRTFFHFMDRLENWVYVKVVVFLFRTSF